MSSFQEVGIEEFHCIQRCPHFRVLAILAYRGSHLGDGPMSDVIITGNFIVQRLLVHMKTSSPP